MSLPRRAARALAILGIALAANGASAQEAASPKRLMPVDEAAQDISWVSFRNRLIDALQKHDRKFLLSVLDRSVRNPLDAPRGVAAFSKQWDLEADDSPLWRELPGALFLGSAWLKPEKGPRQLCAPYVAVKWPEDIDPFDYGAITTREALAKADPSSDSATLGTLSYDIVRVTDWEIADRSPEAKQKWVKIRLSDKDAYVPEEHIRSPIEHRACFVKTESGWRLVAFVVGMEK
ncbi:MAG TPA: hypothetical protein VFP00_10750 [Burkholderiales bacterium]|nr:hypothetical protein [Burkholderiales bacterium]